MYSPNQQTVSKSKKKFHIEDAIPITAAFSKKLFKDFITTKNYKFETLTAHGIIQGQAVSSDSSDKKSKNSYPIIGIKMGEHSYHCVSYTTYQDNLRFINASDKQKQKPDLNLLGISMSAPTIFLTEGFWDMLTLYEMERYAMALPGVNNFPDEWMELFENKEVYIVFDNDKPGQEYARKWSIKLSSIARFVKGIHLPSKIEYNGEEIAVKDISDLYHRTSLAFADGLLTSLIEEAEEVEFNPQQSISEIINSQGTAEQKYVNIATFIQQDIESNGGKIIPYNSSQEFAIALNGTSILTDERIQTHLCRVYGFLPSVTLWRQIYDHLYQLALQTTDSKVHTFSHYDHDGGLLYIGTKNNGMIRITSDRSISAISVVPQGFDGIYIQSSNDLDLSFIEDMHRIRTGTSLESLFDLFLHDGGDAQKFLLKTWFYQTFFEPQMRNILCVIGEPGSGKTMLLKIIKGILNGFTDGRFNPNSIPEEDYIFLEMIKSSRHLFFDEFNESDPSIKTKFRMLATGAESVFREKYARKSIKFRPKVWLAVSAHSPKIRENDIAQRLCIIRLSHPAKKTKLINEFTFYNNLEKERSTIWSSLLLNLNSILANLKENGNAQIELKNYCRQVEMADFAFQVFPKEREVCQQTFENMNKLQEGFSAEFDPLLDLLDDWMIQSSKNYHQTGKVVIAAKDLYNDLMPLAKDKNLKSFPISIQGFGKWIHGRVTVLAEMYGYERYKNITTNSWQYTFNIREKIAGEKEVF